MKATNPKCKITIVIDGEKITASKGFLCSLGLNYHDLAEYIEEHDEAFKGLAIKYRSFNKQIYNQLNDSGYFDDI